MSVKLNTQQFIEKVKLIHGDKYNYDSVDYKNGYSKIIIKCNTCNKEFTVLAARKPLPSLKERW